MKKFIQQNRIFLGLYLLFIIAGAIILMQTEHGREILFFNRLHTGILDDLFKLTTRLAEVPVLIFIIFVTIRFSYGNGLLLALNTLLVFAVTQTLKLTIFADQVRPAIYFEGKEHLNFVQGVEIYRYNSFPSGHTSTAFGLFFLSSILIADKKWSALLFILALAVGISRIYLLEHFFRDVYTGSVIGMLVTTTFYLTFAQSGLYQNLKWKDKALLQ